MSRYEEIETFVRVVEAGSVTGAAQQMRIAKSAVSRRLKELEMRLGVQLMTRTTRTLKLTNSGHALYNRSVGLLADWAASEAAASEAQAVLAGPIRMAAPLGFGVTHIGPIILDFMKQHPKVDFDLDFDDRVVDLVSEGMDLAVRIGELPNSNLIARKLVDITMAAAASPDYLARFGMPKKPEDLTDLVELGYRNVPTNVKRYRTSTGEAGTIAMPRRAWASNGEFLRDAAVAGEGVVIVPRFFIYKNLRDGSLVEILPDLKWRELAAYAVYPPTRHLSGRVRAFVDFLAERFRGVPYWEQP